jgi:hypothetical protein
VVLLASPLFAFSSSTAFPGYMAAIPCSGAALLIATGADGKTMAARVLAWAPLRFFGSISYSLYLWHWPILAFSRHWLQREPGLGEKAFLLLVMVLAATVSWRFVERPARSTGMRTRGILLLGASAVAFGAAAGVAIELSNGLDFRFSKPSRDYFAAEADFNPRRRECHASDSGPLTYIEKCVFGDPARLARPGIALWADSHGAELAPSLGATVAAVHEAVAQITYSSCPPALEFNPSKVIGCSQHNAKTLGALVQDPGVMTVVMAAHYDVYTRQDERAFLAGLEKSILGLRAAGKHVVVVAPIPTYSYPIPQALGMRVFWNSDATAFGQSRTQHDAGHARLMDSLRAIQAHVDFTLFNPADSLCTKGQCMTSEDGKALYFDSHHLSLVGAMRVSRDLKSVLNLDSRLN